MHDDAVAAKQRLHHELIQAAPAAVIEVQDQGQIDDDVLREIERERDLEVQQVWKARQHKASLSKDGADSAVSKQGAPDMRWNGTNREWHRPQKNARSYGVAHLIVGALMLFCDLLLFLVFVHTSPSLVHEIVPMFVVFAVAAMGTLLLGTILLGTSTYHRSPEARNAQQDTRAGVSVPKED